MISRSRKVETIRGIRIILTGRSKNNNDDSSSRIRSGRRRNTLNTQHINTLHCHIYTLASLSSIGMLCHCQILLLCLCCCCGWKSKRLSLWWWKTCGRLCGSILLFHLSPFPIVTRLTFNYDCHELICAIAPCYYRPP